MQLTEKRRQYNLVTQVNNLEKLIAQLKTHFQQLIPIDRKMP